jgi:hypothetical protein
MKQRMWGNLCLVSLAVLVWAQAGGWSGAGSKWKDLDAVTVFDWGSAR